MPKNKEIKKVLVIGSGPIVIGQAAEFDYAGTQACSVLKKDAKFDFLLFADRREADSLKHGAGLGAGQVFEEGLGLGLMPRDVQHGCRVDNLAAHLGGRGFHNGQAGGEGVSRVDDAAVDGGLAHLRGDFLDVRAVGQYAGVGERFLIESVTREDLLRVLADGDIRIAHGEEDRAVLKTGSQLVIGGDVLGIAFRNGKGDLVLEQVDARA